MAAASAGVIAFAAVPGAAQAQDSQSDPEQSVVEDDGVIVVTGYKASAIENLSIKREADAFVDAITAIDVGKYPDKNVADALQRVPGVSITRSGGEGQSVSIRGTAPGLTLTQLNGNYVAGGSTSRDPQRSFNYALLPSNLIAKTEVYKTPQARIDEGGIGGTVIISTRRPLDMDPLSGFANVEGTYSDTSDKLEANYSGLLSWKNDSDTFGILVSYTNQDRTAVGESISTENWRLWDSSASGPFTEGSLFDTAGNEITGYAPFAVVQSQNVEERKRQGYQATVQWRPSDALELTFNYLGASFTQNNDQNLLLLAEWDYRDPAIVPGSVRYNGDTIVAMQLSDPDLADLSQDLQAPAVGSRRSLSKATSNTYDLEAVYDGNGFNLHVNGGLTESKSGTSFNMLQRFYGRHTTSSYGFDFEAPAIINADQEFSDFNRFDWTSSDAGQASDEEFYLQGDLTIDADFGPFTTIDVGAKYRNHKIRRRLSNVQWDDGDPNNADLWGGCCGLGYSYWHTFSQRPGADEIPGFLQQSSGLTGRAGTEKSFTTLNWDAYIDWLDSNFERSDRVEDSFYFDIDEEILAGYVQGNFETDRLSGNVGLRVVNTKQATATFSQVDGTLEPQLTNSEGDVTEFLPSLNLKYELADDLILRGAASRVIARVPYTFLGQAESFNAPTQGALTTTGSKGNTDLKPFNAWQFDAGIEWYFAPGAILGGTVFRKEIGSFITSSQVTETRDFANLGPIEVLFTLPVNGNNATSTGVELFYQQAFDFGGGLIANYTFTDTSLAEVDVNGEVEKRPLPGTSKHQFNVAAYYETDLFQVRAAYNYRSKNPGGTDSNMTIYGTGYGQLDLNGSIFVTDRLSLNLAVINATREVQDSYLGAPNRLYARSYSGRRFYAGINFRF